jgi:hypothetical protein
MSTHAIPAELADLLHDQSLLLQSLFAGGDSAHLLARLQGGGKRAALANRGLEAYRANAGALAERALGAAYPVLAQLMGDESFAPLARYFWQHAPPQRGDVAQWGAALPDYLDASPQLVSEPFLGDVARVEWALHAAATAQDATLDAASFALLASGDPEQTTLSLSDGTTTLASAYPVVSIVHAHLHGEPTLAQAAALLGDGVGEHALVWRRGFKPDVRLATAAEHALVSALQAGLSLDAALTNACALESDGNATAFDFNSWLAQAVQTGLVTGAHLLHPTHNTQQHSQEDTP